MAEHMPTTSIECDVFADNDVFADDNEMDGPREVAQKAWATVQEWVHSGYLPVVKVRMPDGSVHEVDLEENDD